MKQLIVRVEQRYFTARSGKLDCNVSGNHSYKNDYMWNRYLSKNNILEKVVVTHRGE